jgi:ornithine cyclodeaminase
MTEIFSLEQIKAVIKDIDPIPAIEEGFIAYSQGKTVVPPVGELVFEKPPGDVHIKYGYIIGDEYYVIKIASGFYENPKFNLPAGSGLMLLFNQMTGELVCILVDEAYLTNVRTAAAGAVVAKYLAPKNVNCIGIIGAGIQGRMQLEFLKPVLDCRNALVWGINQEELNKYKKDAEQYGYDIQTTLDTEEIARSCNFIVTATPSRTPLLHSGQVRVGTHITSIGSDTPEKNELDPKILKEADIVVADSRSQCLLRGEIHHALKNALIEEDSFSELGQVIVDKNLRRLTDTQISVADLTGVAVQDIQIAKIVYQSLKKNS